jgi:hypothetical protein
MFARVAAFEGGDTERIRELNEGPDAPQMPEGVQKVMVLDDQAGGRRLFIAFFDSREAVESAEPAFESMGGQIPEDVRGRRTGVDVYEVVFEGMP